MDLASIAQQCAGAHRDKGGWRARCPVHQGKSDTSLHLWEERGALRLHCFSGCSPADILAQLRVDIPATQHTRWRAIYPYHDAAGHLLYEVLRQDGKQRYTQRRPHPTEVGVWIPNVKGVQRVLYRLPEVLIAKEAGVPVYLVEGERDVETLRAHGCVATCNPGGAGKWDDTYSTSLDGAIVVLLDDNDEPGRKHRDLVLQRLAGHVKSLVYIDLPERGEHDDVTDWLTSHSIEDLHALVNAQTPKITTPHLVMIPLADVEREDISWLWPPYIPYGKITFIEGEPGNGKTYLSLAIAAAVTRGRGLPDAFGKIEPARGNTEPACVLYITAEDGLGDTIRPRAETVDADLQKILAVQGWSSGGDEVQMFSFQHIQLLENAIRDTDAKLVVIDPIQAFLGANIDMHRANEVRPVMAQVGMIAQRTRCAIVIIRHWNKAGGGSARMRGLGSIDFTGIARSILAVGESPEDDALRIMAHAKSNIGALGESIVFAIREHEFAWYGTSDLDANSLASMQPRKREHQMGNAVKWLKDLLQEGPIASATIFQLAEAIGLKDKSVRRAKELLQVRAYQEARQWFWQLPQAAPFADDVPPF